MDDEVQFEEYLQRPCLRSQEVFEAKRANRTNVRMNRKREEREEAKERRRKKEGKKKRERTRTNYVHTDTAEKNNIRPYTCTIYRSNRTHIHHTPKRAASAFSRTSLAQQVAKKTSRHTRNHARMICCVRACGACSAAPGFCFLFFVAVTVYFFGSER